MTFAAVSPTLPGVEQAGQTVVGRTQLIDPGRVSTRITRRAAVVSAGAFKIRLAAAQTPGEFLSLRKKPVVRSRPHGKRAQMKANWGSPKGLRLKARRPR